MARGEEPKDRMQAAALDKEKRQKLIALRKDTIRKIDFIKKKAVIEHHEVYHAIRDFFKEFLDKRYEFTTNELRSELKKIYISSTTRQQIGTILDDLQAIEYASVHYERQDLIKILDLFESVVKQLIHTHIAARSIFDKILHIFKSKEDPETIISDLPVIENNDEKHVLISILVERCYIALDNHQMHKAKTAYKRLLEEYSRLDDERKKVHYPIIEQTYRDILNRHKMAEQK